MERSLTPLHLQVKRVASDGPQKVAIQVHDDEDSRSTTFGRLVSEASRLGRVFRRIGVSADDLVAVQAEDRTIVALVALAVAKIGGALLPLDPALPSERLARLLTTGRIEVLVTERSAACGQIGPATVYDWAQLARAMGNVSDDCVESERPHGASLCYAISTSGTTGTGGKLVGVTNANARNHLRGFVETYGLTSEDRVAWVLPPFFDVGLNEMWCGLALGAELHVFEGGVAADGEALWQRLRDHRITFVQLTASLWERLPRRPLPHLRAAVTGGSVPSSDTVAYWARDRLFFNSYGPTETTVTASSQMLGPSDTPTLGESLPGVELRLERSEGDADRADAVQGELLIAGLGVARGYLGQPRETAQLFRPDPTGPPGARLFRSGDRVARSATGAIRFLGRLDEQTKLRGTRIDLQEIEAAVRETPGVRSAVVLLSDADVPKLVCFVAPATVSTEECHRHAVAVLPNVAVPHRYVCLDRIPLGPTGKPDQVALKRRLLEASELPAGRPEPGDPVEQFLCESWSELLGTRPAGMAVSWLHAGGDSLGLQRLRSRIRRVIDVDLSIEDLLASPTIEGMRSTIVGSLLGQDEPVHHTSR